ncbi:hypothetical protein V8C40DRAFT_158789 [Trichoderma camerunense]
MWSYFWGIWIPVLSHTHKVLASPFPLISTSAQPNGTCYIEAMPSNRPPPQTHPRKASLSGKATVALTLIFSRYLILYSNFNIEKLLSRDDADDDDDDEPRPPTFFFSPT